MTNRADHVRRIVGVDRSYVTSREAVIDKTAHWFYGGIGGHKDKTDGYPTTRAYFDRITEQLTEPV